MRGPTFLPPKFVPPKFLPPIENTPILMIRVKSPKGSSNTFKTHKNISLYFKRRYLITYNYYMSILSSARVSCIELNQLQQIQKDKRTTLRRRVIWPLEIRRLGSCYSGSIFPYLDRSAFPYKFSLFVLHFLCISLRSVRTSELRSEYFSALTAQSVNKCLLPYAL